MRERGFFGNIFYWSTYTSARDSRPEKYHLMAKSLSSITPKSIAGPIKNTVTKQILFLSDRFSSYSFPLSALQCQPPTADGAGLPFDSHSIRIGNHTLLAKPVIP